MLKGIIGQCRLFVGSRGHSCILSLSSCTPTIAIGHNPKYHGIMKMLNQENFVCRADEITLEKLTSIVDRLWSIQEEVRNELNLRIDAVQRSAILNAKLVSSILCKENTAID